MRLPRALALFALAAAPAFAGGALETIDITGQAPLPNGLIPAPLVPIRWDARCLPARFRVNDTLDPVPNPLGAPFLTVAEVRAELKKSFDAWNRIPTSYVDMRIAGTTHNPGLAGFDMVNELTFRTPAGFGAIAATPSVTLIADTELQVGDDLDGDGDPDVAAGLERCGDADQDGDVELPAGLYRAGTILDSDTEFNVDPADGFRFTVRREEIDTNTRSVDLRAVATHEFGHAHGLSHVLHNQAGAENGSGSTMFPFVDTGDPASERALRTLAADDTAFSSLFYPEGTAASGPAALQNGDMAFPQRYGLIEGTVQHGLQNRPLAGASVFAIDLLQKVTVATAFSAHAKVLLDPANGTLLVDRSDPGFHLSDGAFVLPAPAGAYSVGVQAVDGYPVPAGFLSLGAQVGSLFGQHNFDDELWSGGQAVVVRAGQTRRGVDIVTNRTTNINPFGSRDFVGHTNAPAGLYYAVQIPASEFDAASMGQEVAIHGALFDTFVVDGSVVPRFAEAIFTTGIVEHDGTATLDLAHPLSRIRGFVGRDNDFAPFFFGRPRALGKLVREGIDRGVIRNLFLVLRLPRETPFPGVSALPPLIGLDGGAEGNDVPLFGRSYFSTDGTSFLPDPTFNYRFSLVLSEPTAVIE